MAQTCGYQHDAQNSGKETRSIYKNPEGKKPKAPKYLGEKKSIAMQMEERHYQGIQLTLVQGRDLSTVREYQGSNSVQLVKKRYRDRDQNQCQDKQSMFLVDPFQQIVESQTHEDKNGRADEFGYDADTEKQLGSPNLVRCSRSISHHHENGRNIEEAKGSR